MNVFKKIQPVLLCFFALTLFISSCAKDDTADPKASGTVNFEITDAPIDDTEVEAVFVTVAEVRVDDEAISGFEGRQTIDLMAYQNGNTKALGIAELEEGAYAEVTLVLDYEMDDAGNSPGCYVRDKDQKKHPVRAKGDTEDQGEFTLVSSEFSVESNMQTTIILDFDVRKAIRYEESPQPEDRYEMASRSETESSIRVVAKSKTGTVKGNCSDLLGVAGDRIVVYAYAKGAYDADKETQGQGGDDISFKQAVSSSVVAENGDFQISFLEEGEYELHFAGYEDEDDDGQAELKGMLQVDVLLGILDILGFDLNASASVDVDVTVVGLIP